MKFDQLKQQILATYEDVLRKEKIVLHLKHLDEHLIEETQRLKVLQQVVQKEEKDFLDF